MPDHMSENSVSESVNFSGSVCRNSHKNLETVSELPATSKLAKDSVQVVGQKEWAANDFMDDHRLSGRATYALKAEIIRKRRRKRKIRRLVFAMLASLAVFGAVLHYKSDHIGKFTTRIRQMISLDTSYRDEKDVSTPDDSVNGMHTDAYNEGETLVSGGRNSREKVKPQSLKKKNAIKKPNAIKSEAIKPSPEEAKHNSHAMASNSHSEGVGHDSKGKKIESVSTSSKISHMVFGSDKSNLGTTSSGLLPPSANSKDTNLDSGREKIEPASIGSKFSNIIYGPSQMSSEASNFGALPQYAPSDISLETGRNKIKPVSIGSTFINIIRGPSEVNLEANSLGVTSLESEKIDSAKIGSTFFNMIYGTNDMTSKASNLGHSGMSDISSDSESKEMESVSIGSKISNMFYSSNEINEEPKKDTMKMGGHLAPLDGIGRTTDLRKVKIRPVPCFIPLSYLFSRTCRKLAREKPVFNLRALIDAMMQ